MVSGWVGLDTQNERFSEAQSIGNSPLIRWGPGTLAFQGDSLLSPSLSNLHNNLKRRMTTTTSYLETKA